MQGLSLTLMRQLTIDDLTRRERDLAAREAQLNAKAEHIRKVSALRLAS